MRISLKSAIAGVTTLAVAGIMAVAGASGAAAVAPPYDPDPNAYGTITFYNAAGNVVTSGDGNDPESAKYAVSSTNPITAVTTKKASIALFLPVPAQDPGLWGGTTLNTNTTYPIAAAPAAVSSSTFPASMMTATSLSFKAATAAFVPNTGALANVWQIRLSNALIGDYASASITIDPTTGAWQQVFPVPVVPVTTTTTSLAVTPASPATTPVNPTLTATVSPAGAVGTVEFFDGATSLGTSPVAAGVATKALTAVSAGTHPYTATFIPTDALVFATSTSPIVSYVVNNPVPTPTVALTASSAAPNVGAPVTFTATVAPATAAGTVQFFDGATSLAPAAPHTGGVATLTTSALTAGAHSVTAAFVSANAANFNNATSAAVSVNVLTGACAQTGSVCTDPQDFTVNVPVGSIVISTPFGPSNPFDLGTMTLNGDATELSTGAKSFKAQDPAGKGITITDGRSGNNAWTANLQSSNFTSGPTNIIEAKNLGFTEVLPTYIPGNALQALEVLTFDNLANSVAIPATGLATSKTFATAAAGNGSVYVNGNFTLNAPTSTPAGTYNGTVTFTIS